jgi:hypothetical protein
MANVLSLLLPLSDLKEACFSGSKYTLSLSFSMRVKVCGLPRFMCLNILKAPLGPYVYSVKLRMASSATRILACRGILKTGFEKVVYFSFYSRMALKTRLTGF